MATVIRFARHGTKKRPFYRIVVQDHHKPRDGKFIEHIGTFDPIKGEQTFKIERDRLEYWLSTGAQLSLSVKNRLKLTAKLQPTAAAAASAPKADKAPQDMASKA